MIQRIQTIYLLLVAGFMLAMLFVPLTNIPIIPNYEYILFSLFGLTVILSLIAIFYYKKRSFQIKLCRITLLLLIVSVFFIGFVFWKQSLIIAQLKPAITFPIIAIILDYLAIQGIRKDDKLVNSLNRLR